MKVFLLLFFIFCIVSENPLQAQVDVNYDEGEVPDYTLPKLLKTSGGSAVNTINEWKYTRRPEILGLFAENVYGKTPNDFDSIQFEIANENNTAIDGKATSKEVDITISRNGESLTIRLNLLVPNDVEQPAPAILLINHRGSENMDIARENKTDFWPAELILDRGYAAGVFAVGDVADDDPETYSEDLLQTLYPQYIDKPNSMKALGAWGWGAMRIMDYFETDDSVDEHRSVLVGHSRGGKAALWAGAQDERWSIIYANESGAGGAALSKRKFGETIRIINQGFPYWFTPNFDKYNDNEAEMPFDQHMLIASIAPRGVYVTAAEEDQWADPNGMYLALLEASKVYKEIYGIDANLHDQMPAVNNPTDNTSTGFHIRQGKHDLKLYDWKHFLNFADRHFQIGY